jgi:hypothetical protein
MLANPRASLRTNEPKSRSGVLVTKTFPHSVIGVLLARTGNASLRQHDLPAKLVPAGSRLDLSKATRLTQKFLKTDQP